MKLPDSVKALRMKYVSKFPVPQGSPGPTFEEEARQWSIHFAETVAFYIPSGGWGMKRASSGRPISKDTLSQKTSSGMVSWDLLVGTGTGHPTLSNDPESMDTSNQVFVEVSPVNHLSSVVTLPPVETPPPTPPAVDLSGITKRLDALETTLGVLVAAISRLPKDVATALPPVVFPSYSGKLGLTINLDPQKK